MKPHFHCILPGLLLIACEAFSQMYSFDYDVSYSTLGTANIEVTYKLEWVADSADCSARLTDIVKLHSGGLISKSFSSLISSNDSVCTALIADGAQNVPAEPPGAIAIEVYKFFDRAELMVKNRVDNVVYKYVEDMPVLKWAIHAEKEQFNGYQCQKATTVFRGRTYEAWFTPDIPVSDGPWKFSGLPGLILEVHDSKNHYLFSCIGIRKVNVPIETCNRKFTLTTREKLNEMLRRKFSNLTSYYAAIGVTYARKIDGKIVFSPADSSLPYNPIELE